jgi:hypothetical protein
MEWLKLLWTRTKLVAATYTGTFIVVIALNQLLFFGFCLNPICLIAAMPHCLAITVVLGTFLNKVDGWGEKNKEQTKQNIPENKYSQTIKHQNTEEVIDNASIFNTQLSTSKSAMPPEPSSRGDKKILQPDIVKIKTNELRKKYGPKISQQNSEISDRNKHQISVPQEKPYQYALPISAAEFETTYSDKNPRKILYEAVEKKWQSDLRSKGKLLMKKRFRKNLVKQNII